MPDAVEPAQPVLEPEAAAFAEATANPPYLFDLQPAEGRKAVDEVQSGDVAKPETEEEWVTVQGGPTGSVRARIVRPAGADGTLPVILYIHGAGWVFGNAHTHDRLVRELAVGAEAAVVFPEYDLSPEVRYPVAIEQNFTVARWVVDEGAAKGLDGSRLAVAGGLGRRQHDRRPHPDGQGARRTPPAAPGTLLPGDGRELRHAVLPPVRHRVLPAPRRHAVVLGTSTPPTRPERAQVTASPLRATTEQLAGLPPALVITGEADVLRDEGEAYANKLRAAGVPVTAVRFQGIIHDFVMLNALRGTHAAEAAISMAVRTLHTALHTA
ncbi:alpha/beta hydrolase [Streptomyces echinatus]